jgi:hypothetical protein
MTDIVQALGGAGGLAQIAKELGIDDILGMVSKLGR